MLNTHNQVSILGFLGNDPVLFRTESNRAFCLLKVWTDESYTDNEVNVKKFVEWHRIACWGVHAENAAKYLNKNRQILVTGKLRTKIFEKDNIKHRVTEIIATDIKYLGGVRKAENTTIDIKKSTDEMTIPI